MTSRKKTFSINYKLKFSTKFQKQVKDLNLTKKQQNLVDSKLKDLINCKENLDIKPLLNSNAYRLRVGDYRIFFKKEEDLIILFRIRTRQDAYKD